MLLQFSNKLGGALFVPSFTIHSLLTRIISTFNIFDGDSHFYRYEKYMEGRKGSRLAWLKIFEASLPLSYSKRCEICRP